MTDISSLYLKTHNKTGKQYLGATHKNPKKYLGSSKSWKKHIKKHGRHDVTTDILFQDTMNGKNTSKRFQNVAKWTSHLLGVTTDENFYNKKHEDGVLGAKNNVWGKLTKEEKIQKWKIKLDKHFANKRLVDYKKEEDVIYRCNDELETYNDEIFFRTNNYSFEDKFDESFEKHQSKISTKLCKLSPRRETIVRLVCGIGVVNHSFQEIGQQFSLNSSYINTIFKGAIRRILNRTISEKEK